MWSRTVCEAVDVEERKGRPGQAGPDGAFHPVEVEVEVEVEVDDGVGVRTLYKWVVAAAYSLHHSAPVLVVPVPLALRHIQVRTSTLLSILNPHSSRRLADTRPPEIARPPSFAPSSSLSSYSSFYL